MKKEMMGQPLALRAKAASFPAANVAKRIWELLFVVAVLIIFGTAESTCYTDLRWLVQLTVGAGLAVVAGNKSEVFK